MKGGDAADGKHCESFHIVFKLATKTHVNVCVELRLLVTRPKLHYMAEGYAWGRWVDGAGRKRRAEGNKKFAESENFLRTFSMIIYV